MKSLWRLAPYLMRYWLPGLLALLTTLLITIVSLTIPEIIQQVIDVGLVNRDMAFMQRAALLILGLGVVTAVLTYFNRYQSEWLAAKIGYDLRNRLYNHIQNLSFTFHDHMQTGQLISRSIEDVRAVERFFGFGVIELLRLGLLLVGISGLLFSVEPRLAWIALAPMVPLVAMTGLFGQRIGGYFLAVDRALGDLSALVQESVSGAQVVRAFARESYENSRFQSNNRKLYDARVIVLSKWANIMPTSHFLVTLATILILWFGGQMVIAGQMTVGEVVAFNSYLLLLAAPAQQLVWLVNLAGEAVAGVDRAFEILDRKPEIASPPAAPKLPPLRGEVVFNHVCLRYSGQNSAALEDINLHVLPNHVVALIGATGSGKTSLVNLIPRFFDPTEGQVCVDGIDVRSVELQSLRRQIGIVLQTSLLFTVTIAENIAYGRPDASFAEVQAAARAAQAHEFIEQLPQGYETMVGERGVTLSGGQRQRIAIARALIMDPRILILDDSTSSVDTETERQIQEALHTLMEGRTTFVIAHRLATVRRADLILVLDDGRIVERGRHAELLALNGLYRQIYELQLREQEAAGEKRQ